MRRTFVNSLARHELSNLCASCARKRLAASTFSRAPSDPRTYSTVRDLPSPKQALANASPRRWLSVSCSSRAPQQDASHSERSSSSSSSRPKLDHTPLPYYALFPQTIPDGPPPTGPFDIDTRALRREFLQLQAASHPDFHHSAATSTTSSSSSSSTTEQQQQQQTTTTAAAAASSSPTHSSSRRKAEALSSHINAAYKTLSDPLPRAQYLLAERYGVDLAGDEAARLTGPPDAALLAEVLHARETIEDAASERDLDGVRAENEARVARCLAELAAAFAAEDLEAAVRETVRLRYWVNIRESVENWEEGQPIVLQH